MTDIENMDRGELQRRLANPAKPIPAPVAKQRLQVNNAPDVHFEGSVIHEYSTQNAGGAKERWTEIRLWETTAGAWIVESVGCSKRAGESNLRDVIVLNPVEDGDDAEEIGEQRIAVMDFLGWTHVAKAFARAADWDMVRRVA
jgi:hypothetical protein